MSLMYRAKNHVFGILGVGLAILLSATHTSSAASQPQLLMQTTLGDITLELDAEKAPISTLNFIQYAQSKFYDGTVFHRVMPNFMIQGGGYFKTIEQKIDGLRAAIKNEWKNGLKNVKGSIAMARTRAADSATSQFFINVVDNPGLDQPRDGAAYAVFGRVIKGMDTVEKIRNTETKSHPNLARMGKVVPIVPVIIDSVRVIGKYDVATLEKKVNDQQKKAAETKDSAAKGKAFLAENAKKPDVNTTPSGLQYRIIKTGNGVKPKATDQVTVHYRGRLINGTEFDSSYSRNAPATFSLNRVIPGWTEGLQLISVGGKAELFIPSELGYGKLGAGNVIPPNSTLIYKVELIKIN
ncbi:MAG: Peptidyl-prolyl cis-trans isomerase A [Verrucomicrobia subdivision 3 bacterium]|nr:Peptidyl-prolyl cis-trans isomerase A [Limisphaerales bacterium]MCS1415171.1 Peptidyl-prolyl cis-trans isomerase A [Limisphaerales bacterium]